MLLESTIYQPASGGFVPHIKWNTNLIKALGGNQSKGLNEKLRSIFPEVVNKLNEAGITSDGREMYAKNIIQRVFSTEAEAKQAQAIYESILKSL